MAGAGPTPGSPSPGPDDINQRLAEIAAELAAEAKFKEPSAAERARRSVQPAQAGAGRAERAGTGRPRRRVRARARTQQVPSYGASDRPATAGTTRSVLAVLIKGGRTVLQIGTNYLFAYAVQERGMPGSRIRIVARAVDTVQFAQWYDPGGLLEPWVIEGGASYADAQCGTTDGFVHPAFPALGPGKEKPTGRPADPYDLTAPQPAGKCQAVTGT
jgi:hypothetical protein